MAFTFNRIDENFKSCIENKFKFLASQLFSCQSVNNVKVLIPNECAHDCVAIQNHKIVAEVNHVANSLTPQKIPPKIPSRSPKPGKMVTAKANGGVNLMAKTNGGPINNHKG